MSDVAQVVESPDELVGSARAAHGVLPQKAQLHELTSMRFLAAMAVLVGHFSDFLGMKRSVSDWFSGGFGVSFFFVLSGFILCYRYWDEFEPGVARTGFRRFIVARIARVYPSYAMALVLITAMYMVLNHFRPGIYAYPGNAVSSWLANLFALQTFAPSYDTQQVWNGPGWSISTELCFYLACPFILAAVARHCRGSGRLFGLVALAIVYAAAMQTLVLLLVFRFGWDSPYWADIIASRNIVFRIPEFLAGVATARLLYDGHLTWLRTAAGRNAVIIASVVTVAILNGAPWPHDDAAMLEMRQYRLNVAYVIPFAAMIAALAAGGTILSPLLARRPAVFLGDVSYGVYIYHWIPWTFVAIAIDRHAIVPNSLLWAVVIGTIMLAAASYIFYERPARLYLRRRFGG